MSNLNREFKIFALLKNVRNLLQNPYDNIHLTWGMLLHYLGKLKIQIFWRYSADIEENANKLQVKCIDFYYSTRVTVYAECIYVLTKCLKYTVVFFSVGTTRSAAAWPLVNCACVPQLFQQLINTTPVLIKFWNIFQILFQFKASILFQLSKIIQFQLQFQFHVLLLSFSFSFCIKNKTSNHVQW